MSDTTAIIERCRWEFGDGSSATTTAAQVSHIYDEPDESVTIKVSIETTNLGTGRGEIQLPVVP
jgi:PKD repeat protein